jgi:hypothetical protein
MAIAHPAAAVPREQAAAERGAPGSVAISLLVGLSITLSALVLYVLWKFWPTEGILASKAAQPVNVFGIHRHVTPEVRLLVVVALGGTLGGLMHSTRSLAWYVGHEGLRWRWIPYYLVTIVIGAGLASIFYLLIRGGLLGDKATTADANPYGFVALAALVGLFSEQALEMLRRVANQVFALPPQGADTVATNTSTTVETADLTDSPPTTTTTTESTTTTTSASLAARTGTASNVAASSATLEGDVTPNGPQTSYHFDYGTTDGYGVTTPVQIAETTTEPVHVTADVNGLSPDTEHHFRLVVSDSGGAWTTGDDATFTTAAG